VLAVIFAYLIFFRDDARGDAEMQKTATSPATALRAGTIPPTTFSPAQTPAKSEPDLVWCGYGAIKRVDDQVPPQLRGATHSALQYTVRQLQDSAEERERALGGYAAVLYADIEAMQVYRDTHPECAEADNCAQQTDRTSNAATLAALGPLVRLAGDSRDPASYAAAFHACTAHDPQKLTQACLSITATRWAQLDPGNAAPWIFVADDALQRADYATRDDALFQISKAGSVNLRLPYLPAILTSAAGSAQAPELQVGMALDLYGAYAAQATPAYASALAPCLRGELRDSNQRQLCSDIADKLSRYDENLTGRFFALQMGKRAGWPQAQLTALQAEIKTLHQSLYALDQSGETYSCTWLAAQQKNIKGLAQFGELAWAKRQLAAKAQAK